MRPAYLTCLCVLVVGQSVAVASERPAYQLQQTATLRINGPTIPRAVVDLGIIKRDHIAQLELTFKNETDLGFDLTGIKSGCSCLKADFSTGRLAPRGEITVSMTLSPPPRTRQATGVAHVKLLTSSSSYPELPVVILYRVSGVLAFKQRMLLLSDLPEQALVTVQVENTALDDPAELLIENSKELGFLEVSFEPGEKLKVGIQLRKGEEFPSYELAGSIQLRHPQSGKRAELPVYVKPKSAFRLVPETLRFRFEKESGNYKATAIAIAGAIEPGSKAVLAHTDFPIPCKKTLQPMGASALRLSLRLEADDVQAFVEKQSKHLEEEPVDWRSVEVPESQWRFLYGGEAFIVHASALIQK